MWADGAVVRMGHGVMSYLNVIVIMGSMRAGGDGGAITIQAYRCDKAMAISHCPPKLLDQVQGLLIEQGVACKDQQCRALITAS